MSASQSRDKFISKLFWDELKMLFDEETGSKLNINTMLMLNLSSTWAKNNPSVKNEEK